MIMINDLPINKVHYFELCFCCRTKCCKSILIDVYVSVFTEVTFVTDPLDDEYDCAGYSLRHYNETRIDQRLESIENAVSLYDQLGYYQHLIFYDHCIFASYLAC